MRKLTQEEFIEKSRQIHGNKYDYSKVKYIDSLTKVCIVCPEHGEFWQLPKYHLRGSGCYFCGIEKLKQKKEFKERPNRRLSGEIFITRANSIHNNKYDYSKVNYTDAKTKVCIICPEHGEFWQLPFSHLNGHGCAKCEGNGKLTTKDFINKATQIHNNKYDYSKVVYINSSTKVCIICPEHGEFWQSPYAHLSGQGCPICKRISISSKLRLSKNEFIKKSKEIHGDKYDYSKVEYINSNTPVCIICPEHGEFWQKPSKHLIGHGCHTCNESKLEREINTFLTENKISFIPQKTFEWLKNEGPLKLDFFLPDYNIAIECQGEQHFYPVDFANKGNEWSYNRFDYIKKLDKIKNDLCEKNNIKILYYTTKAIKAITNNKSLIIDKETIQEYLAKVV